MTPDRPRQPRPKPRRRMERLGRWLLTPTEAAALTAEEERERD